MTGQRDPDQCISTSVVVGSDNGSLVWSCMPSRFLSASLSKHAACSIVASLPKKSSMNDLYSFMQPRKNGGINARINTVSRNYFRNIFRPVLIMINGGELL